MRDVVIVAAGRTAVGTFGGSLSKIAASDLGATVIKGLIEKVDLDPAKVDEVILGFNSRLRSKPCSPSDSECRFTKLSFCTYDQQSMWFWSKSYPDGYASNPLRRCRDHHCGRSGKHECICSRSAELS